MGDEDDNNQRVLDKSALAKTLTLMVLALLAVMTYGANLRSCVDFDLDTDAIDNEDVTKSDCRMNLYGGDSSGNVYATYYLLIWICILGLSVLGFVLLCCNCSVILNRVFAFGLFGGAVLIGIAEVMTMMQNRKYADDHYTGDEWTNFAVSRGGLNAMVFIMETYILINTAADAFIQEYKSVE